MLVSSLAALSAAVIAVTVFQTAAAYRALPARVPMGFALDGTVSAAAPRPMIWLLVAVQLVVAVICGFTDYALATHAPNTHGTLLGSLIVSTTILLMMWRTQLLMISAALSGAGRVPVGGFFLFLAAGFGIIVLDAIFIG